MEVYWPKVPRQHHKDKTRIPVEALEKDFFHLPDWFIPYSLNKRKRWLIPETLKRADLFQDDSHKVTSLVEVFESLFDIGPVVSKRGHELFHSRYNLIFSVVELNAVDENGQVVHRKGTIKTRAQELVLASKQPKEPKNKLKPCKRQVHELYIVTEPINSNNYTNRSIRKAWNRQWMKKNDLYRSKQRSVPKYVCDVTTKQLLDQA
ncbi:hypothetical protein L596_026024 [Steinernema carpocapsae]|uniref:Uncharacterized protein n=1 Tax=Steinernema carpocapsae TaxID=34508 RepID=A0A4U5M087_STECR|nr:hypothetical protein L596_026024 [Steinernema carpocapsae]